MHPDCPDPDRAFWVYRLGHWHYPEILAELTQRNGPRSRMELDAVAQDLVRSAVAPDPEWVVEQIRTHFEGDIRAGAEDAAREGICLRRAGTSTAWWQRRLRTDAKIRRGSPG